MEVGTGKRNITIAPKKSSSNITAAAKNKIMGLYNQFIAPPPPQHKATTGGLLETDMGNLSLTENNNERQQQLRRESVDLYEWDGNDATITYFSF